MGKNIALLYMSAYFAQPAPEGSKNRFLRTQTNEAAVSALWKDPASRPDKIVALCSDTVRTKPTVPAADGSGNKVPTLEYFKGGVPETAWRAAGTAGGGLCARQHGGSRPDPCDLCRAGTGGRE